VRHGLEPDRLAQVRAVGQQLADAAIVLLLELLEDQAGKQLWLSELAGTVNVGIVAESFLAGSQRDHRHLPWRLAGDHFTSNTFSSSPGSAAGFLQSRTVTFTSFGWDDRLR
jgi:hypothetical protein